MVGRDSQKHLDRLIGEVARGQRSLRSISDPKVRDSVRIALRMHEETPAALDAYVRARMRARILARLEPRRTGLLDHAWTALELLGRPAPYIVRGVALGAVMVCLGLSAVVASADTLPDDLLYPLKIASEQVRLALADAPGDRAGVELSIAEHRLGEAEKLEDELRVRYARSEGDLDLREDKLEDRLKDLEEREQRLEQRERDLAGYVASVQERFTAA